MSRGQWGKPLPTPGSRVCPAVTCPRDRFVAISLKRVFREIFHYFNFWFFLISPKQYTYILAISVRFGTAGPYIVPLVGNLTVCKCPSFSSLNDLLYIII